MNDRHIDHLFDAICFVAVAFLIVVCLLIWSFKEPVHKPTSHADLTDAQLQKWYEGINEEYFWNQLPKNVTVKWGDLAAWGDMGVTLYRPDGSILILIERKLNPAPRVAEITAFHEACHVKTHGQEFDDHGPKFEACMVHLADQGAFKGLW